MKEGQCENKGVLLGSDQRRGGRDSVRQFPTAGLYGGLSYHQQCERERRQLCAKLWEQKALQHAIAKHRGL